VSEASLDIRTGNVFTFKDGRVVRLLAFMPPERALDEVGLSDWGDSDVTGGEPRE
jgi:hypothetical protein